MRIMEKFFEQLNTIKDEVRVDPERKAELRACLVRLIDANSALRALAAQGKLDAGTAAELENNFEDQAKDANKGISALRASGNAAAAEESRTEFARASDSLAQARAKFQAGLYGDAFIFANQALRIASQARVLLDADVNLDAKLELTAQIVRDVSLPAHASSTAY